MKTIEEVLGKVLNIDPSRISDETGPSNTEAWDSFSGLLIVSELEKNFSLKLTIEEVILVKNVRDIRAILNKHGIKA